MNERGKSLPASVLIAYYATVAAFLVASFFPQYRIWGMNWWGYFPLWVKLGLLGIGLVAPLVIDRVFNRTLLDRDDISVKTYRWLVGGFAATMIALFYLLRARTHFLGDGYTLLSLLSAPDHLIKPHEYGGTILQYGLYVLLGSHDKAGALVPYQIVSIGSGLLFLMIAVSAAAKLIPNRLNRLLLILVMSTGGYMLMFFGYVENYSLFVVSIALYGLAGLLIIDRKINRWWIVPVVLFAVTQHIFGVVLIPPTIGLLLWDTRIGHWFTAFSRSLKIVVGAVVGALAAGVFAYFYSTNLFFRLALISFTNSRFTTGGYTLLSIDHLIDFVNLLILVFPGIAVATVVTFRFRPPRVLCVSAFLAGLLICCLGAAFVFEPKLGMPRDWDLFAFAGVPLILAVTYSLFRFSTSRTVVTALLLVSVLNVMTLVPRAVSSVIPEQAIAHTKAYADLDIAKSGPARYLISNYIMEHGDTARALAEGRIFHKLEPDLHLISQFQSGRSTMDSADYAVVLQRAIVRNPTAWGPWANLGVILLNEGLYDSALYVLTIADALNPYNAKNYSNIAFAYFYKNDFSHAESYWLKSLRYSTSSNVALVGLVKVYRALGNQEKYSEYFMKVVERPDAPPEYLKALGDYLVQEGRFPEAAIAYKRAVQNGLSQLVVDTLMIQHPQLMNYLKK
jgi:hypothetical protein